MRAFRVGPLICLQEGTPQTQPTYLPCWAPDLPAGGGVPDAGIILQRPGDLSHLKRGGLVR